MTYSLRLLVFSSSPSFSNNPMAISRNLKNRNKPRSPILLISVSAAAITFLFIFYSSSSSPLEFSFSSPKALKNLLRDRKQRHSLDKYLNWGDRIDCPGKQCDSCEGLGHQESSLRCALEEALLLQRWAANSCSMDSLYDLDLIADTVPVIVDNSKMWYQVLLTNMKLGNREVAHVEGVDRVDLKETSTQTYCFSWFMECKDRNNHSAIKLPYSFLPIMAAKKLRDVADQL